LNKNVYKVGVNGAQRFKKKDDIQLLLL